MSGQQKGVQFSEAVGVGTAPPTTEYNRTRGAAARVRQGSPNFQGYFRPPGTQRGNSNVAALAGQMGALTLGQGQGQAQGQGQRRRKSRKSKKSRKSRKGSRKN
jgi:hypothetical protein